MQQQQQQRPPIPKIANQQQIPRLLSQKRIQLNLSSTLFESNISLQSSSNRLLLSNQSMQSMGSSDEMISQQSLLPTQQLLPTQTFSVIYNRMVYMIDPYLLMNASVKFNELIQPVLKGNQINQDAQLEVLGSEFSSRNMNNFLKLCQNLPTDVDNSEMKEICEIAKMFQADKIYNTGISFINKYIDSNFSVPDSKYDESDGKIHMFIECENHIINHGDYEDINNFNDEDEEAKENQTKLNEKTKENQIKLNEKTKENQIKLNEKSNDNQIKLDDKTKENQIKLNEKTKENQIKLNEKTNDNQIKLDDKTKENNNDDSKKVKSVIYSVFVEKHQVKCPVYRLSLKGKVLYSAKQKYNNIYIAGGEKVHINKDTSNHVGHIYQDDNKTNFILADKDKYEIKYVDSGRPKHLSLSVSFPHNGKQVTWTPKTPKFDSSKNKYYLNFHGGYHRNPIKSSKNIVLANACGHTVFIVRKMAENMFELESLPSVSPLIIFTIGLSDIVGQYNDEFGGI